MGDIGADIRKLVAAARERAHTQSEEVFVRCRVSANSAERIGILSEATGLDDDALAGRLLEQAIGIAWDASQREISVTAHDHGGSGLVEDRLTRPAAQSRHMSASPDRDIAKMRLDAAPDRMQALRVVADHLLVDIGRVRGTIATSKDGLTKICCLVSRDYSADRIGSVGNRFWFTVHKSRQFEELEIARTAYLAFICGDRGTPVVVPLQTFRQWTGSLPPYTHGEGGWHIHVSSYGSAWELRTEGRGSPPIDISEFVVKPPTVQHART